MISFNDITAKTRLLLGDTKRTVYSPYEVEQAVNVAYELLLCTMTELHASQVCKKAVLTASDDHSFALPDDFSAVERVYDDVGHCFLYSAGGSYGTYSISRGRLYALPLLDTLNLVYAFVPEKVSESGDVRVDLDSDFSTVISRAATLVIKGDFDAAEVFMRQKVLNARLRHMGPYKLPPLWGGYNP